MKKGRQGEAPVMVLELFKGSVIAAALSMLFIALYALAMWQQWLTTDSMNVLNTAIKTLCAAAAGAVAVRRCTRHAWLFGALAGLMYSVFVYLLFSILTDVFRLSLAVLSDLGIGIIAGALGAMILRAAK